MYTEYVPTFGLNLWVNVRKIFQSHVAAYFGTLAAPSKKKTVPCSSSGFFSAGNRKIIKNPRSRLRFHRKIPNKPKHGGRNSPVLFHHHRLEELRHDLWFHLGGVLNGAAGGGGKCSVTKSLWCTKHLHLFKVSQKYENWRIMFSFKCQNQSDHGYVFQKRKVGWSIENGQFWALFCQVADVHLHFWGDLLAAHYLSQVFTYRMFVHPPFFPLPAGYRPKTSYLATDPRQCP